MATRHAQKPDFGIDSKALLATFPPLLRLKLCFVPVHKEEGLKMDKHSYAKT